MRMYGTALVFGAASLLAACAPTAQTTAPRTRTMSVDDATRHHQPVQLQVAWREYREHVMRATGDATWAVTDEVAKVGEVPVLVVSYPDTTKDLTLRMDIDDALLGKLLKHTLMTQQPITTPLGQYLQVAQCSSCHPADVDME